VLGQGAWLSIGKAKIRFKQADKAVAGRKGRNLGRMT
jgi:hypothetical protein